MKRFRKALKHEDWDEIFSISSNKEYAGWNLKVSKIKEAPVTVDAPAWSGSHYPWGLTNLIAIAAAIPSIYSALAIQILYNNGADIEHAGPEQVHPIHIASRQNTSGALRQLVKLGVDIEAKTITGKTPIHYCS
ncbi:hypothetical protein TWF481_002684 [Arthrobotrys musiformis]|uniref:Uncharacterized protein n=1 Tax=Arthrobotrys musiformis TaxID=47236 RepID=A0AAV9VTD8_9PEZI